MNDLLFQIGSNLVLPAWVLLIFFPHFKHNHLLLWVVVALLSAAYLLLMFTSGASFNAATFNSIAGIRSLFANEAVLTAGWLHYLAFDLWIGKEIVSTGKRLQMARWKYTLPLPLTFLFGPAGWLVFQLLKCNKNEVPV